MKVYISNNTRLNKAAMLLASMSPDMVEDIVNLVVSRGRSVVDIVSASDGPPRPLAVLSREFISDEDFPPLLYGLNTMILSSMRELKSDAQSYEKILTQAYALPTEIAGPLSKQIETYDVVGGHEGQNWLDKVGAHVGEGTRRVINWLPEFMKLPLWYNDQDQRYDVDFLYELKKLGNVCDDLQSRVRLMKGQAGIANSMGLFTSSALKAKGDIYGDIYGDPSDVASLELHDSMRPLMGGLLPLSLFGGLKDVFKKGAFDSSSKLGSLLAKAGVQLPGQDKAPAADPAYRSALTSALNGQDPATLLAAAQDTLNAAKAVFNSIRESRTTPGTGDAYEMVGDCYGEPVANAWMQGNIPAMIYHVIQAASDTTHNVGDPELAEAIVGDVYGEIDHEWGDLEHAVDKEMGGLFSRARARAALRRSRRRKRRATRRERNMRRREEKDNALADAKYQAARADVDLIGQFNQEADARRAATMQNVDATYTSVNQPSQYAPNIAPTSPTFDYNAGSSVYASDPEMMHQIVPPSFNNDELFMMNQIDTQ